MNRLLSELRSTPPSPRTDSVTSSPRTDGGHHSGRVQLNELHVQQRGPGPSRHRVPVAPMPPVASTTAGASNSTNRPVSRK